MPVTFIETPRLILRELVHDDAHAMFEMDSDPEVHRYLGQKPVKSIEEIRDVIDFIRDQYKANGIGRWAVVSRENGNFVGWAGLKLIKEPINDHVGYHDLGYRFLKKHWGQGFASECAASLVDYGFNILKQEALYAYTDSGNAASQRILIKSGFEKLNSFFYDEKWCDWFKIQR